MGLTNRILKNSRVSFPTLAPSIQDKSIIAQYSAENAGAIIDFFLPDIKREDDAEYHNGSLSKVESTEMIQHSESPAKKLRVRASNESIKFSCIISEIILLNELSGYLVRLAPPDDAKDLAYDRKIERIHKFPNIQFVFDPIKMSYIQEDYEDDAQKRIAEETSIFVSILRDRSNSDVSHDKSDRTPEVSMLSGQDEITRLQNLLLKGKSFGDGIKTLRLIDGEEVPIDVRPRLLEKQLEEQQEQEEAKRKEGRGENKKEDIFQSSLKSKKAFNAALNEKSVPSSIKRLRIAGYSIVLLIIALASTEFGLLINELKDIEDNIFMVKYSRQRIALQMKMVYYLNKIVLVKKPQTSSHGPVIILNDVEEANLKSIIQSSSSFVSHPLHTYSALQSLIT